MGKLYCSTPENSCPLFVNTIDNWENPLFYCQGDVRGALEEEYYTVKEALKELSWLDDYEKESLKEDDADEYTRYARQDYIPRPSECKEVYSTSVATFVIPDITE